MAEPTETEVQALLQEVRRIQVQSNRLVRGVMAGGYSSVFRGAGVEFLELREYAEGDDPRTVDWNVSARMGRPFVKKFADERDLTVVFLLDVSASMRAGFGVWSLRQTAARVCACLALSAVANNDRLGLLTFSERVEGFVPPQKGLRQALRIVRDCLATRSASSGSDLTAALRYFAQVQRRRAVVFLISDFLTAGWRQALAPVARRHDVVAVRLLPVELTPPRGLLRVHDPESGQQVLVDFHDARVRQVYGERVKAWRARTEDELRRARVDRLDIAVPAHPDPDALARPILQFFELREKRWARR